MQVQQPSSFGDIGSVGEVTSSQLPSPPESMAPSDYLSPIREEALQLLKPDVRQARILCFAVASALALGFGLGWAGWRHGARRWASRFDRALGQPLDRRHGQWVDRDALTIRAEIRKCFAPMSELPGCGPSGN